MSSQGEHVVPHPSRDWYTSDPRGSHEQGLPRRLLQDRRRSVPHARGSSHFCQDDHFQTLLQRRLAWILLVRSPTIIITNSLLSASIARHPRPSAVQQANGSHPADCANINQEISRDHVTPWRKHDFLQNMSLLRTLRFFETLRTWQRVDCSDSQTLVFMCLISDACFCITRFRTLVL